jgi:hypothetical protein
MGLSEIAAGIEVTAEQHEHGVAAADGTETSLSERLASFDEQLPCSPDVAATLFEAYIEGASIGRAAAVAAVPETTAAKTLYRLGEPIDPLTPTASRVLDDWLAGELSRTEAKTLSGLGETEFALGAYIATHDPIDGAETALAETASAPNTEDPLSDARSDLGDLM